MSVIQVSGLPNTVKMPKLIFRLRDILKRVVVSKFWIKEIADMRNSDLKEAKIEFLSSDEAHRALKKLDKLVYHESGVSSQLRTKLVTDERKHQRQHSPHRSRSSNYRSGFKDEYYDRYSPRQSNDKDRSRSPIYNESSKLDLEIELLRKQRMVIEEERRLLLERKKLELIKEFGPSASKELEHMEKYRDRRQRPKKEERAARLSPPPQRLRPKFPQFYLPCKIILGQMRTIINEKAERGEKATLEKLIRTQLRRRIALALTAKDFMPGDKIVELYREIHPATSDEEMVTTVLKNLRLSHWPVPKQPDSQETDKKSDSQTKDAEKMSEAIKTDPDTATVPTPNVKEEPATAQDSIPEQGKPKEEPATAPDSILEQDEPKEEPDIAPDSILEKEPEEIKNEVEDEVDAGDITVEVNLNGPDDDWIENGVDWNDEDIKDSD